MDTLTLNRSGRDSAVRRTNAKVFVTETCPAPMPVAAEGPRRVLDRSGFSLAMGAVPFGADDRPSPEIVRGRCPECGGEYVSNLYWHKDCGYLIRYECWEGLLPGGVCDFYAVP